MPCIHCGLATPPKGATGPAPRYCSKVCQRAASYVRRKSAGTIKKPPLPPDRAFACVKCAAVFAARKSRRFCTRACETRWYDEDNPVRCSEPACERGARAKGLCNPHWRRRARAEGREKSEPWNERRAANYEARRALKMGADIEVFTRESVFARDDWICGLCSEPVDPSLAWPHAKSASLDHAIPLSRGGAHSMSNTQCAHLDCNVSKGNRVPTAS